MWTRGWIGLPMVAVLVASTVLGPAPISRANDQPTGFASHPCATATKPCRGSIGVPLDWNDPDRARIEVGFQYVPRADLDEPARGTVLAHLGGSGEAIPAAGPLRQALGPVLQHQNLLLIDARGWGASSPVRCADLDQAKPQTIRACARQLRDVAPWLTSDQIAADFDAVRRALGLRRLTLFGSSRGTVFMQAYAVRYPEHTKAVALDSVFALDDAGYVRGNFWHDIYAAARKDLDLLCDRSPACRGAEQRPDRTLAAVVDRLRAHPDPDIDVGVLFSMTASMLFDATVGSELNAALTAYLDGDPAPLRRLVKLGGFPDGGQSPEDAAALALICGETAAPYDRHAGPIRRQRQLDAFYRERAALIPFDKTHLPATGAHNCVHWPTPRHSPAVPPYARYPRLPVLVVGGNLDSVTPEDAGRSVADRFPNGVFVETDFGRHGDSRGLNPDPPSGCVQQLIRAFLAAPEQPVEDPSCSGETYVAHGRFPRNSVELPPARGVPSDAGSWTAAGFATAMDAALRWHPASYFTTGLTDVVGLRGGDLTYDRERATIRLDAARFVSDVAVTGTVRLHAGLVHIDLQVQDDATGRHTLRGSWPLSNRRQAHQATLDLDGVPYNAELPRF